MLKQKKIEKIFSSSKRRFASLAHSFKIYTEKEDHADVNQDPFIISTLTGFLPKKDPVLKLPSKFDSLNFLLEKMRWNQPDGSKGLLAKKELGSAVRSELRELEVDSINDKMIQLAVFRDYCFLASAYLLENCHHTYLQTNGENYGLGKDVLPMCISRPLVKLADKLNLTPFLEYNSGYALNNWFRKEKSMSLSINNLELHRSFINFKSETGFILVHVAINQHGGMLVKAGIDILEAAEMKDRDKFNKSMVVMRDVLIYMNQEFERMYYESNPMDYNEFRTFILGIKNQPMFPNGVIYEGCFNNQPQYFRGESGANDSIIPFCDNILQITQFMPHNPLTEMLRDFRTYRPKIHRDFLSWSESTAKKIGVLDYAKKDSESMLYLLEIADQIRAFRHRHWILTNLYIIKYSKHPVATGGSPIITWLPNQLLTVIKFIKTHSEFVDIKYLPSYFEYNLNSILRRCEADERIIKNEVEKKRKMYGQ